MGYEVDEHGRRGRRQKILSTFKMVDEIRVYWVSSTALVYPFLNILWDP